MAKKPRYIKTKVDHRDDDDELFELGLKNKSKRRIKLNTFAEKLNRLKSHLKNKVIVE